MYVDHGKTISKMKIFAFINYLIKEIDQWFWYAVTGIRPHSFYFYPLSDNYMCLFLKKKKKIAK